jgi:DNA polymerase-3 subunit alpha
LVSYQTAWLKAHFPAAFMAAVLSSDMDNTDKVVTLIEDCRNMGLTVLPPSVNQSHYRFTVTPEGKILYGLGAIKGVGEAAIEGLIDARRSGGVFTDLFNFCNRVITSKANRRVCEALIRAGALDDFNIHRASLMASLEKALKLAEQCARDISVGQTDLFAQLQFCDSDKMDIQYLEVPEWDDHVRLLGEKETLGLYLTGHPIQNYLVELKQFTTCRLKDIRVDTGKTYIVPGLVIAVRTIKTKKGARMAIVTLDDMSARMEVVVMPDTFENCGYLLQKDEILIVEGEAGVDNFTGLARLKAKKIMNLSHARQNYAKRVILQLDPHNLSLEFGDILEEILQRHSGECPLSVEVLTDGTRARLHLGRDWAVKPDLDFMSEVKQQFGDGVVRVSY